MPFSMKEFMELVEVKNSHFSRFKESSLAPLIEWLGGEFEDSRGMDWRAITGLRAAHTRKFLYKLDAAKKTKYHSALQYLYAQLPNLRIPAGTIVAFHTDGTHARVEVFPGAHSDRHEMTWYRNGGETAHGWFGWTPATQATGWIQAYRTLPPIPGESEDDTRRRTEAQNARTRRGMGTFLVYYQVTFLCSRDPTIYSGVPEGEHARAFRTRLGFVSNRRLDGAEIGMRAAVSVARTRAKALCPGWVMTD